MRKKRTDNKQFKSRLNKESRGEKRMPSSSESKSRGRLTRLPTNSRSCRTCRSKGKRRKTAKRKLFRTRSKRIKRCNSRSSRNAKPLKRKQRKKGTDRLQKPRKN